MRAHRPAVHGGGPQNGPDGALKERTMADDPRPREQAPGARTRKRGAPGPTVNGGVIRKRPKQARRSEGRALMRANRPAVHGGGPQNGPDGALKERTMADDPRPREQAPGAPGWTIRLDG